VALKRVLKYFNIAVVAALIVLAAATYWFAWRPLPQTSGSLRAPVSQRATIARDALGVPHISAATVEDALFLQGYATAQDRLWQMDLLRRLAAGRLAEIFGPDFVALDRESRRFRLDRLAHAHAAALTAEDTAVLAAYARGVNWYIDTHRGNYPLEFRLLGYDPRPWTIPDSLLLVLEMYRDLTMTWRQKLEKSAMLASGNPALVAQLFPTATGSEIQPGSNAWVLAGARTAGGRPILANDPHLEYSMPGIWYMVHLRAPGLDVAGVALPGVPCVVIGHNRRLAWGMTSLGFDVQDFYVEKMDFRTGRYAFRNQVEQARLERELIPVKGAPAVEFAQFVTRHGPVWIERGQALALRWTAAGPGFALPLLDMNRAQNSQEFVAALSRYPGPAQNFVYADVDGNIGYHAAGRLPIRKTFDGGVPVDGSSGNYEWEGYIPFDQLPLSYNPPSGLIVTANQNPFPRNYPYRVGGNFAAPYRSSRIRQMLSARNGWRADDMLMVQKDVYSAFGRFLARELVLAYARRKVASPQLAPAVDLLAKWDGAMEKGTAAPLLVTLVYQHLRTALAERASPGNALLYQLPPAAAYQMAPAVVERVLRERPREWFDDYDQLLLRTLLDALEEGSRTQGGNIDHWDYGRYNELLLMHPVLGRLPLVGGYFNIGPVPQSGSPVTVKQTTPTVRQISPAMRQNTPPAIGPSMRTGVDLAGLDRSYMNIVAGESGQALSRHYRDQWAAYYSATSFPMQFLHVEARDTLSVEPER